MHFRDAVKNVGIYHSREHLLGRHLFPLDRQQRRRWARRRKQQVDEGCIERLVRPLRCAQLSNRFDDYGGNGPQRRFHRFVALPLWVRLPRATRLLPSAVVLNVSFPSVRACTGGAPADGRNRPAEQLRESAPA